MLSHTDQSPCMLLQKASVRQDSLPRVNSRRHARLFGRWLIAAASQVRQSSVLESLGFALSPFPYFWGPCKHPLVAVIPNP